MIYHKISNAFFKFFSILLSENLLIMLLTEDTSRAWTNLTRRVKDDIRNDIVIMNE